MKTKQRLRIEIKEISAEGYFEGLLSPYGNVDEGGDVVVAGAFDKSLQEQGNKRPLLWQHKTDVPIGELTLESRPEGLWCKGQLLMDLPEAQRAYLLVKARIVRGLSIGFATIQDAIDKGVRYLKEIKLFEGSVVTFPMNLQALITTVKGTARSEVKGDFNEELQELQLQDAGYQMRNALSYALSSIVWAGMTRDEKVGAAEAVIQQFSDAYMAYLPAYLDRLTEEYGAVETWSAKRFETKEGRKFSAATKQAMQDACAQIKGGHETLVALLDDEAGEDDSTTLPLKAATLKPEPATDHSAITTRLTELKETFQWNPSNSN